LQIATDEIDNVDGLANPLFIVKRRSERHGQTPWTACGGKSKLANQARGPALTLFTSLRPKTGLVIPDVRRL
jgi:hypothetical protein